MILKPCPFCGAEAAWSPETATVVCGECCSEGPFPGTAFTARAGSPQRNIKANAEAAWNQRHVGWISVKDELPATAATVLIANPAWAEPVAEGYFTGEEWFTTTAATKPYPQRRIGPPTHWMHLPEPTSVEEGGKAQ